MYISRRMYIQQAKLYYHNIQNRCFSAREMQASSEIVIQLERASVDRRVKEKAAWERERCCARYFPAAKKKARLASGESRKTSWKEWRRMCLCTELPRLLLAIAIRILHVHLQFKSTYVRVPVCVYIEHGIQYIKGHYVYLLEV